MIANYTCQNVCAEVLYIGTISISTTLVLVDLRKQSERYVIGKAFLTQGGMFAKMCKTCKQFKKINTLYGNITHKNIAELKLWDLVHLDLIGTYSKSIVQHQPGGAIIWKNSSLTCMATIDSATGWF